MDMLLRHRAGIDADTSKRHRHRQVDRPRRILAAVDVGDVGKVADRQSGTDFRPQLLERHPAPRTEYHTIGPLYDIGTPAELLEIAHRSIDEMLGTQPYLRFGMIALEQRHLFLREREEAFERQIARITALDTPMVDRRQTFEDIFPETQFGGLAALRFEIGTVVVSHDPDIETVGLGDTDIVSRYMAQHLDAVHPEKRQFADILFEVLLGPCFVGRLGPRRRMQFMPPDRILGSR